MPQHIDKKYILGTHKTNWVKGIARVCLCLTSVTLSVFFLKPWGPVGWSRCSHHLNSEHRIYELLCTELYGSALTYNCVGVNKVHLGWQWGQLFTPYPVHSFMLNVYHNQQTVPPPDINAIILGQRSSVTLARVSELQNLVSRGPDFHQKVLKNTNQNFFFYFATKQVVLKK